MTKMAVTPFDPQSPKRPCYMQTSWLFYGTAVIADQSLRCVSGHFGPLCTYLCTCTLTFIYELDLYRMCKNELLTLRLSKSTVL